jgi:branched-chain amino acid transport system substrate-binding protein
VQGERVRDLSVRTIRGEIEGFFGQVQVSQVANFTKGGRKMKKVALVIFVLGIFSVVFGTPFSFGQDIKIAALFPLSGPIAALGDESYRGVELAKDVQNGKGGILGKKIQIIKADAPSAAAAVGEAERLISTQGVKVFTGSFSSSISLSASEVTERNRVIYFELGAISDDITKRGFKYLFRIVPPGSEISYLSVSIIPDLIAPKLGLRPDAAKLAIVHEDTLYGTTVANYAEKKAKELKIKVVAKEGYSAKAMDLSSLIQRLKALAPDVVIASSYMNDAILMIRQSIELGFKPKAFIGTGAAYSMTELYDALGKNLDNIISTDIPLYNINPKFSPGMKEFVTIYKEKYKQPPRSGLSLMNYMGALTVWKILEKAGSVDPEAIRKAAVEIDIPPQTTPTGWGVKFAPPGDPNAGQNVKGFFTANQWEKGELWTVWPKDAAIRDVKLPLNW